MYTVQCTLYFRIIFITIITTFSNYQHNIMIVHVYSVCLRSLGPVHIVSENLKWVMTYFMKWVKTYEMNDNQFMVHNKTTN